MTRRPGVQCLLVFAVALDAYPAYASDMEVTGGVGAGGAIFVGTLGDWNRDDPRRPLVEYSAFHLAAAGTLTLGLKLNSSSAAQAYYLLVNGNLMFFPTPRDLFGPSKVSSGGAGLAFGWLYGKTVGFYLELGLGLRETQASWSPLIDRIFTTPANWGRIDSVELALATGMAVRLSAHTRLIVPLLRVYVPYAVASGGAVVESTEPVAFLWLGTEFRFEIPIRN